MLTHFIYVQYGCENQSKVVYSYSLGSTSAGSVPSGNRSVTSSVSSPRVTAIVIKDKVIINRLLFKEWVV